MPNKVTAGGGNNVTAIHATPLRLLHRGKAKHGLTREVVDEISWRRNEPAWLRDKRLDAFEVFERLAWPTWAPNLSTLDMDKFDFLTTPEERPSIQTGDPPGSIRRIHADRQIDEAPQGNRSRLIAARQRTERQGQLKHQLREQGIVFVSMDVAVKDYPDLVREYFMRRNVPIHDSKSAALHAAIWSGGSFVYLPEGARLAEPLLADLRGVTQQAGPFDHTLLIAEPGSQAHFAESAVARSNGLHAPMVEIFVKDGASVRHTAVQNLGVSTYSLGTRRALVQGEDSRMEWVGASLGGRVTIVYPSSYLLGRGAAAHHFSLSVARAGQRQDTGAKVMHVAPDTQSRVIAKSISLGGGRTAYRGLVRVTPAAVGATVSVRCAALLVDALSRADIWPELQINQSDVTIEQETTVEGLSEGREQQPLERELARSSAGANMVRDFIAQVTAELPEQSATALNRSIRSLLARAAS
jgi:Fe-S cluster assembly protein SufB